MQTFLEILFPILIVAVGLPLTIKLGFYLGYLIERTKKNIFKDINQSDAYFKAMFSVFAKMCKADGRIDKEQIDLLSNLIDNYFKLEPKRKKYAVQCFNKARKSSFSAKDYLRGFARVIKYDQQLGDTFVRILFLIAQTDTQINNSEEEILFDAEKILKLRPGTVNDLFIEHEKEQYEQGQYDSSKEEEYQQKYYEDNGYEDDYYQKPRAETNTEKLDNAYIILECQTNMTDREIKRAYRNKCKEFHPDKLQSKGLPKDFIDFANKKMVELQEAYDLIMKSRVS